MPIAQIITRTDAQNELTALAEEFERSGQRGPEVADRIDALRCALEGGCEFCEGDDFTRRIHETARAAIVG